MENNEYGPGFWLALIVGIIGVLGFIATAGGGM